MSQYDGMYNRDAVCEFVAEYVESTSWQPPEYWKDISALYRAGQYAFDKRTLVKKDSKLTTTLSESFAQQGIELSMSVDLHHVSGPAENPQIRTGNRES